MKPNCMILRCEDPSFNWAASIKSIYSTKPAHDYLLFNKADDTLFLGPFQGRVACVRIPAGKGVCGRAIAENRIQPVDDVHAFPGHIACDAASNAEIVFPLSVNGQLIGVLDIDSTSYARFDAEDEDGLKALVAVLCAPLQHSDVLIFINSLTQRKG
ncbi:GAF domain-containing protein [BEV proteobacterium]|nr:GAF domain-containing protein [Candidatus Symbiopectobacterium sp. Chty_BC]